MAKKESKQKVGFLMVGLKFTQDSEQCYIMPICEVVQRLELCTETISAEGSCRAGAAGRTLPVNWATIDITRGEVVTGEVVEGVALHLADHDATADLPGVGPHVLAVVAGHGAAHTTHGAATHLTCR